MSDRQLPVSELPADPEALLSALEGLEYPDTGVSPWVYVIALLVLVAAVAVVFALVSLWRRRRQRQTLLAWKPQADRELAALRGRVDQSEQGGDMLIEPGACAQRLSEASALARRIALVADSRSDVAPLSGGDWLRHLDRLTGSGSRFSAGTARALADAPYQRAPQFSRAQLHEIIDAIQAAANAHARRQSRSAALPS